jgi:hypothetical protein
VDAISEEQPFGAEIVGEARREIRRQFDVGP